MHFPCEADNIISSFFLHGTTPTNESPSSSFIAIFPLAFTLEKSLNAFLLTLPDFVANIKSGGSSSFSGKGIIVVTCSPSLKGNKFTIGLPLA